MNSITSSISFVKYLFEKLLGKIFDIEGIDSTRIIGIITTLCILVFFGVRYIKGERKYKIKINYILLLFLITTIYSFFYSTQVDKSTFYYTRSVISDDSTIKKEKRYLLLKSSDYSQIAISFQKENGMKNENNIDSLMINKLVGGFEKRDDIWKSGALNHVKNYLSFLYGFLCILIISFLALVIPSIGKKKSFIKKKGY